jgi:DNA-binding PadR family transcriptional regulator
MRTQGNSKAYFVLSHIAKHGPKTEYEFYKDWDVVPGVVKKGKKAEKISRGTINYCLNKLSEIGLLRCLPSNDGTGRPKKQFYLTFQGAISYINSLHLEPPIESRIPSAGESLLDYSKRREKEEEQYLDEHSGEFEKLTHFLKDCGEKLDYVLFKEAPWLVNHYGHLILYDFLDAAFVLEAVPNVYDIVYLMKLSEEAKMELGRLARNPLLKDSVKIAEVFEGENLEADLEDQIAMSRKEVKKLEETQLKLEEILNSKSWMRDIFWRRAFAAGFARQFINSHRRPSKPKGPLHNEVLYKFFAKVADDMRSIEVVPSKRMAETFKGSAS